LTNRTYFAWKIHFADTPGETGEILNLWDPTREEAASDIVTVAQIQFQRPVASAEFVG